MRHVSLWKSHTGRYVLSVLKGLFCVGTGGLCMAGMLLKLNFSAPVMIWLMHGLWSIGAFTAGRCAGFHGRKHGILTGLYCAFWMSLLFLAGSMLMQEEFTVRMLVRIGCMLCAGTAGGVAGVNARLTRPPY